MVAVPVSRVPIATPAGAVMRKLNRLVLSVPCATPLMLAGP